MYAHYKNKKYKESTIVDQFVPDSLTLVTTEKSKSIQKITIDVDQFYLYIQDVTIEIAANKKLTYPGIFEVIEKWHYPYWKSQNGIYLPAEDNPIGSYLIILRDVVNHRKIPVSLHRFTQIKGRNDVFSQGASTSGCVTTTDEDMAFLFKHIQLGDQIIIQNSYVSTYRPPEE